MTPSYLSSVAQQIERGPREVGDDDSRVLRYESHEESATRIMLLSAAATAKRCAEICEASIAHMNAHTNEAGVTTGPLFWETEIIKVEEVRNSINALAAELRGAGSVRARSAR